MTDQIENAIFVSSLVSHLSREGIVSVQWGGKACQLSIDEARQLGQQFIAAAEAAETDAGIYHTMVVKFRMPEDAAFAMIVALREYRDEREKKEPQVAT